jgi:hypothetical protein
MLVLGLALATAYMINQKSLLMHRINMKAHEEVKEQTEDATSTENSENSRKKKNKTDVLTQPTSADIDRLKTRRPADVDFAEHLPVQDKNFILAQQAQEAQNVAKHEADSKIPSIQGVMLVFENGH